MNTEQMIAQAEAIIKSQPGYSYNPAKLAEIISAGEIPEDVCLCSMSGQNFYREGDEIVAKRDGQEIKRTPLDDSARQQVLVMYAAHAAKTSR